MIEDVKRAYMETDLDWDWEQVELLDVYSIHDAEWLIETPNFTAIGTYSCGELVEIHDIEVKKNEN